jgi:hypothetical protein
MATQDLMIGNLSVQDVFATVKSKGLSHSQATSFVGEWLRINSGKAKRVFNYVQSFPAVDNDCKPVFARSFQHQDWIDGESVVQASQTTEEEGFNERFHRIENDLDAMHRDVAMAFTCINEMRHDLRNLLDELRGEINRINTDIDNCCNQGGGGAMSTLPGYVQAGSFLGKFKINEKSMQLWNTQAGMVFLPDLQTVEGPIWNEPRTQRAGQFMRYLEENRKVRETFPQEVDRESFLKHFGNEELPSGLAVRDLVVMLPEDAKFFSLDAMSAEITERETAALRTTPGVRDAAALSLGLAGQVDGTLDGASIEQFNALPMAARTALVRNGITTIGKLSSVSGREISAILEKEKVGDVRQGDVAEALGMARLISKL